MRKLRIGAGAGFSGDRIEPAVELAEAGALDYLVFECLAERTIAIAQSARRCNPQAGYDPRLERRMRAVLPVCARNRVKIISNMGAANPWAAAQRIGQIARELGVGRLNIAAILGDDVFETLKLIDPDIEETGRRLSELGERAVSANAYIGAGPIVEALARGADIVITGRTSDPALFLGPLQHAFGWSETDWESLGKGVLVGHLLECAGQVTGGYFVDPPFKTIPNLARLGFPIAEVQEDGEFVLSKVEGSGGAITEATCKEQLLYEIHDPRRYVQPDVVADFSEATVKQIATDKVKISGALGHPRPDRLKVSVGYLDGWIGEGQISYAGDSAVDRARLGLDIVRERIETFGPDVSDLRLDVVGVDSLHGAVSPMSDPYEARLRVAAHVKTAEAAAEIGAEVESLYTNGPAGGGGVAKSVREVMAIGSAYVPRDVVRTEVRFVEFET